MPIPLLPTEVTEYSEEAVSCLSHIQAQLSRVGKPEVSPAFSDRFDTETTDGTAYDFAEMFAALAEIGSAVITTHQSVTGVETNLMLHLPGELRNKIYEYTLNMGGLVTRPVGGFKGSLPLHPGAKVFQLCKQINHEARSLMELNDVAYIPIMRDMRFEHTISRILRSNLDEVCPFDITVFVALTTFMKVHLHLHRGRLRDLEAAVIIFIHNSHALVRSHGKMGKRHALVHLEIDIGKPADEETLIALMGKDADTLWKLRYRVKISTSWWTTSEEENRNITFRNVMALCEQTLHRNVRWRVEVYGEETWSLERKHQEITRTVIPCLEPTVRSCWHEPPDSYHPLNPGYTPEIFPGHGTLLW